jgi:hypothetical protein
MLLHFICEVCGTHKILQPDQAYAYYLEGWDYPPFLGEYGVISPRTCGSCPINGTLWWAMNMEGKKIDELNERQLQTLERISHEPESIMVMEEMEK